jgi:ABC-type multidrug transport system fused ATPase/permease subunit
MSDAGQRRRHTSRLYARIFQQIRRYWPHLVALFLLGILGSAINLLVPLPLKIAVDSAIADHPLPPFLMALLPDIAFRSSTAVLMLSVTLLIAISILLQLQDLLASLLASYAGEKIVLDFRARLVAHAQRLSFSYHDAKGSADSIYRIQTDAMALQYLTVDGFIPDRLAAIAGCARGIAGALRSFQHLSPSVARSIPPHQEGGNLHAVRAAGDLIFSACRAGVWKREA